MIETKDLVEFVRSDMFATSGKDREYYQEIITRLRELDKLKKETKSAASK